MDVPIERIDHVQLAMPAGREDEARSFYGDLLGIPETPKPPHLARRGGCWFEGDGVKVHLGVEADFRPARKAHPALLVSGLSALVDRIVAAGVEVVDDEPLEGYVRVYANDPFGNRLELMEPLADAPLRPPPRTAWYRAPPGSPTASPSRSWRSATPTPSTTAYWPRWEALFTVDALVDYRSAGGIAGTPAVMAPWLAEALATYTWCLHSMSTHEITFTGPDTAEGRLHVHNRNGVNWKGEAEIMEVGAVYHDTYRRSGERWRFAARVEHTIFITGGRFADMVARAAGLEQ